ncbi:MAG TPA: hypothetical protein VLF89_00335 [Candidatus Saccharimonadales bacterium]|nr:hypothetical protein [Candidatus Saccharimonadales bacterium]
MVRTQIYIEETLHKDLVTLASQEGEPMAKIARDLLREGIKKRKTNASGIKTLLALADIGGKSDDPHLSENIDHYLYGAPKKKDE